MFWSPPSLPNGPITGYNVYIELLAGSTTMREEVDVQVLTLGHLVPHQTVGVRVCQYQCGGGAIVIAGTGDNTS